MITAEQKIGEKVFAHGASTKFPVPEDDIYHMIIADTRGYLDGGGDVFDYRQMAYGAPGIPPQYSWTIHYWKTECGKLEPIKGLFEESCSLQAAKLIRERIHFLGFVCEREYCEGEIPSSAYYVPNPHLLSSEAALKAYEAFPLKHGSA
jgi:hypothetical protein